MWFLPPKFIVIIDFCSVDISQNFRKPFSGGHRILWAKIDNHADTRVKMRKTLQNANIREQLNYSLSVAPGC